ncbi:hypothetical protein CcaCcLH18_14290 [Colletotrichum camelliae]|nr:hypothetical protein CcaCcLH18_14290 [Colletotrichum camelliae]
MGVTKTQYDVLSQELSKHGATIKTRWRSFTSSQRAQCLEAVNGIKNPKHWKKNPCGDIFFHIAGVSLRDIISNPEVLLSLLEYQVAGTFGGQVSQVHAAGNRRSKFVQNTLFNNPDEAHGAGEEFLNCSRGINLPGSELACEGIARSPCAVKFTAPHNQMHMLKFLNETIAQLLKYYPGTEQKEEEQIEEVLSSDITRLHIKDVPTPGRPESKGKHNDHVLPKTVNLVTAEVFWTIMGKDRARTRVSWNAFEKAMGFLGFSVVRCSGSAVTFAPEAEATEKRSITLHRPHNGQIEGYRSLILSRRLGKVYGWEESTFLVA